MYRQLPLFLFTALMILFGSFSAMAGWGDALKQAGDEGAKAAGLSYTPSEAVAGIQEVLSLGTNNATKILSKPGGFSSSPVTSLSLPDGLSSLGDSSGLLSSLNKAAESAAPETGNVFLNSIQNLSTSDASALSGSGQDAITRYFEQNSRDTLKNLVKPIVDKSITAAGVDSYLAPLMAAQQATGSSTPFDPSEYLTEKTLDGMFNYMAETEKDLRSSGGAGASELLQKLF